MTERPSQAQRPPTTFVDWMAGVMGMMKAAMPKGPVTGSTFMSGKHSGAKCARHYQNKVARNRRRNRIARASRRGKYLT